MRRGEEGKSNRQEVWGYAEKRLKRTREREGEREQVFCKESFRPCVVVERKKVNDCLHTMKSKDGRQVKKV